MSFSHWLAVAALAALPLAVTAQQPPLDPADATVSVPTPGYESAFTHYRTTADEQAPPDKLWRMANEEVNNGDAHAGHATHDGPSSGSSTTKSDAASSQPGEPRTPGPQSDPHAGHAGHHSKGQ